VHSQRVSAQTSQFLTFCINGPIHTALRSRTRVSAKRFGASENSNRQIFAKNKFNVLLLDAAYRRRKTIVAQVVMSKRGREITPKIVFL
jgi:hypothetical protein